MFNDRAPASATCDRLYLMVTALLVVWFCQDIVFSASVPFFRDLSTYFYPLRFTLFESYRSGGLPLWDRRMAMGFPVLADFQSGTFYPPHFLLAVFPFFRAIQLIFLLHFLIAVVGAYKLFRLWKYRYDLSILGALLFTLGGTVVSLTNVLNHFEAAIWLPWVILFWEKAVQAVAWKSFLTFALTLAVQFLAGSPEMFIMSMALVLIDGVKIKASGARISYGRMASIFLYATLLVAALTMVQLLPTAELFLQSRRNEPIPTQEALYWSLRPGNLLNLFFLDKEVDPSASFGMRFFFAREASFFVSYYLGATSVFGICLWLCSGSRLEKLTVLGLVAGSLVIALGSYTPIYPFLVDQMPILGVIRFPEKFFFFSYALSIHMAIKGLAELPTSDKIRFKKGVVLVSAVCVAWVGVYLYFRSNLSIVGRLIAVNADVNPSSDLHTKIVAAVLTNLERQVVLSTALLLLFVLAKTQRIRQSIVAFLLVSVTFVDLAWAHREFLFPLNPDWVHKSSRILQEPDPDRNRLFYYPSGRNLHPSFFAVQGQPSFKEASALFFQNLLPNEGIFHGFDYFQEIDALARRPYTEFLGFANQLDTASQIRLLGTFNVKYLVSFQPVTAKGIVLVDRFPQYYSWLYKIERTVPRIYVVNKSTVETNSVEILQRLASPGFDPTQEVVLDAESATKSRHPLVATAGIVRYENQVVTVQVSLNDSGILVLADSYYPGWKAYVDGKEEVIRKANLFFRAVPLPAGNHMVEFRYEPTSFKIGLSISLATIVVLLLVSIVCALHPAQKKSTKAS
jgi:hypothetical protein